VHKKDNNEAVCALGARFVRSEDEEQRHRERENRRGTHRKRITTAHDIPPPWSPCIYPLHALAFCTYSTTESPLFPIKHSLVLAWKYDEYTDHRRLAAIGQHSANEPAAENTFTHTDARAPCDSIAECKQTDIVAVVVTLLFYGLVFEFVSVSLLLFVGVVVTRTTSPVPWFNPLDGLPL
jgi:hypothetical protein